MNNIAIIGLGCGGFHALQAIRQGNTEIGIDVYSNTGVAPYNPMLTTYYVGGKLPLEGIFPFGALEDIKKDYNVNIIHANVTKIQCKTKTVVTVEGERSYDKILIATGAGAFIPPSFMPLKDDVFCMRTLEDAEKLKAALENNSFSNAIVVGASMVGIKVAELLYNRGIHVTMADMTQNIFALAAYPAVARMIEKKLSEKGIGFRLGSAISGAQKLPDGKFQISYADGSTDTADMLVLNIGTRTALSALDPAEIKINRGIVVNEKMETSVPDIYSAGDCCEGQNLQSGESQIIGLWANAGAQGRCAGANMVGNDSKFLGNVLHNITHFMDMDFIGMGDNRITGETLTYVREDKGVFIEAILRDGKPVGFNILNNCLASGIFKAYFMKLLQSDLCSFTPVQRGMLEQHGVSRTFLADLEGRI
ncbi:MAG: FAD-dependent oxidoreductase [Oscillospiraceae bacterium]